MNEEGKSLLELMVVVAIVGLVAVLAGQGFLSAAWRNQGMAVRAGIASELRVARHMASTKGERIRVRFEPDGMRLRTEQADSPARLIRQYDFADTGVLVERLSNGTSVVFYPSGRTATPTTVTLYNRRNGGRRTLTVSLTGRVSLK